jgi:hypothetical protein
MTSPFGIFFAKEITMNGTSNVFEGQFGPMRKVSQRLPDFLDKYPPDEGWGIKIEVVDPLSCRPGLLELYKECIRSGRTARSLPDPNDPAWKAVLFVAHLTKDGKSLTTASCLQAIEFEYDYESAETRARGRLLSALGFGPEVLDEDELRQSSDRGKRIVPTSSSEETFDDDDLETIPEPELTPEEAQTITPTPERKGSDIPAPVQQQVDTLIASLEAKGEDFSAPTTKKDALKFIRKHRGGNGAKP